MSLKKKDQSAPSGLRVAANDPHLVSLGGGRLSTAVTLHYLPVGDVTIGSSPNCNISLNGSGVRPLHCTVYRSEEGEVTIVPENDARVLIDGNKVATDANLTQGAMLTIGNSNYLRFNNPAEAQLIKSTIGSNERISMPHIDFTQDRNTSIRGNSTEFFNSIHETVESQIHKKQNNESPANKSTKVEYMNLNNFHSPKVFTADSVTVNAPAKDVLGPKYASFAKNLVENHKNDKNYCPKNNEMNLKANNNFNIPTGFIQNPSGSTEFLAKVNNNMGGKNQLVASTYDRYPKPGTYGGLQLFPMNGINSEINSSSDDLGQNSEFYERQNQSPGRNKISPQEQERLDEILKICTEYDRQNQSLQSSPIVQNRIKTNGSLPREKKAPFYDLSPQSSYHSKTYYSEIVKTNSGYENVRITGERRIEINSSCSPQKNSGYENVVVGKCIPQSPRTKIRTTCASPKKEISSVPMHNYNQGDYSHLIQSFEDKLKLEMQAIKESPKFNNKSAPDKPEVPKKRDNRNINNLTLNLKPDNNADQPTYGKIEKFAGSQCTVDLKKLSMEKNSLEVLKQHRDEVLSKIRKLKTQIADVQRQEDEVLRELDMEKALVSAELASTNTALNEIEKNLSSLQAKIYRLEAQRNANRVMQETQQVKLKQAIEMKQEHILRLEKLIEENKLDDSLKDELNKNVESLENDKKTFEDLEFQYLEEETDWLAYREELHSDLKALTSGMEEKRSLLLRLQNQEFETQNSACKDTKTLEKNLLSLLTKLERSREDLQAIDRHIFEISGQHQTSTDSEDEDTNLAQKDDFGLVRTMSQSLFGSTEILSAKPRENNLMTRSINENMFFNNIEMLGQSDNTPLTSTPKKELTYVELKNIDITPEMVRREHNDEKDPILRLKYNVKPADDQTSKVNLKLSLGSDDFEVNPLEERVPSQDDIERICRITSNAPISTEGASSKIFESIKEIERNRQLLLAQQGSHVIEHERQKIIELKKKSHDEARAYYLSSQNGVKEPADRKSSGTENGDIKADDISPFSETTPLSKTGDNKQQEYESEPNSSQQRYSQPELLTQRSRPLSEANSEISYDNLSQKQFKSINDIPVASQRLSGSGDEGNRSSINSNNTVDGDKLVSGSKRNLPKHQRPLTRYLPIMSPDLDLRQHIESAGHQIALCPHVFIDKYSCRGYLHKLGATFHGWSRRWFVLDRQRSALIYYSDKSEKKSRGGAYFSTIDEVYLDHLNTSKSGRPHCTFIVKTKKRSYHLQAASDAAARIWIDAIITGAQGNIDY